MGKYRGQTRQINQPTARQTTNPARDVRGTPGNPAAPQHPTGTDCFELLGINWVKIGTVLIQAETFKRLFQPQGL